MLAALQQPLTLDGKEVIGHVSVGIATALSGTASPDTLLGDADLAMYFAKRQGKSQYQVFVPEMRADLLDRLQLGEDLRAAIDADAIQVHYQPVVDIQTGAIVGAEALARWNHPTRGAVGPAIFIAVAEELNLATRIDAIVLRRACEQGEPWRAAGFPALRMAVNLSGSNLGHPDLVASVAQTLRETGFPAANLELELTEGVAIAESAGALATLQDLKALGLHLAIDDFGTGYSALSRLRALPFDTLKVDKVFVDELPRPIPPQRWPQPSSTWPACSAFKWSPRAWKPRPKPTTCACAAATSARATCSAGRSRRRLSGRCWLTAIRCRRRDTGGGRLAAGSGGLARARGPWRAARWPTADFPAPVMRGQAS